jgi:ribosome-associated toxin RatA of RatAB toxin-antitoxin module
MKTIHKTVLLAYSAEEMFSLVTDVPRYSEFLPWCDHSRIIEQHQHGMTAEIGMSLGGIRKSFTTQNTHTEGRSVSLKLLNGPFKQLEGHWSFTPLGQERACKVELHLSYSFESMFGALVGPIFDRIAASLVDAFVKRAEQVYR